MPTISIVLATLFEMQQKLELLLESSEGYLLDKEVQIRSAIWQIKAARSFLKKIHD